MLREWESWEEAWKYPEPPPLRPAGFPKVRELYWRPGAREVRQLHYTPGEPVAMTTKKP